MAVSVDHLNHKGIYFGEKEQSKFSAYFLYLHKLEKWQKWEKRKKCHWCLTAGLQDKAAQELILQKCLLHGWAASQVTPGCRSDDFEPHQPRNRHCRQRQSHSHLCMAERRARHRNGGMMDGYKQDTSSSPWSRKCEKGMVGGGCSANPILIYGLFSPQFYVSACGTKSINSKSAENSS